MFSSLTCCSADLTGRWQQDSGREHVRRLRPEAGLQRLAAVAAGAPAGARSARAEYDRRKAVLRILWTGETERRRMTLWTGETDKCI